MSKLPTTWTTRDGRALAIKEMDDQHLVNTIRMLQRNVKVVRFRAEITMIRRYEALLSGIQGEHAREAADAEIDMQIDQMVQTSDFAWLKEIPVFRALTREAKKRGLSAKVAMPGGWTSEVNA